MTWKEFKKKNISLDYTVMLLPHSQKKPIHFKTPVWTFGLFFLFLLLLTGTSLFFAGSRLQLARVREEKAQLEQEWELLAEQKRQAEEENETLRLARELQEQEISELEQRTRDTLKELEELVEREAQIREELGLQQMLADGDGEGDGAEADRGEGSGPEGTEEDERQLGGPAGEGTGVGLTEQEDTRLAAAAGADLAAAGGLLAADPAAGGHTAAGREADGLAAAPATSGLAAAGQGAGGLAADGLTAADPGQAAAGILADAAGGPGAGAGILQPTDGAAGPALPEGTASRQLSSEGAGPGAGTVDAQVAARTAAQIAGATGGTMQAASVGLPVELAEDAADFQSIQAELSLLQDSLAEKTGQYAGYQDIITEQKEAEAAQIAQKEALRRDIVGNALQYVGNRYVYGGNDPHTGVDCSGFTRYILGDTAGVYLNRTAASQSTQGQAVSAEEARPGDLVFYSNGGGVNHVAIYIGDGQVVHASNERTGIITSDMYYRTPVRIMNVLGD